MTPSRKLPRLACLLLALACLGGCAGASSVTVEGYTPAQVCAALEEAVRVYTEKTVSIPPGREVRVTWPGFFLASGGHADLLVRTDDRGAVTASVRADGEGFFGDNHGNLEQALLLHVAQTLPGSGQGRAVKASPAWLADRDTSAEVHWTQVRLAGCTGQQIVGALQDALWLQYEMGSPRVLPGPAVVSAGRLGVTYLQVQAGKDTTLTARVRVLSPLPGMRGSRMEGDEQELLASTTESLLRKASARVVDSSPAWLAKIRAIHPRPTGDGAEIRLLVPSGGGWPSFRTLFEPIGHLGVASGRFPGEDTYDSDTYRFQSGGMVPVSPRSVANVTVTARFHEPTGHAWLRVEAREPARYLLPDLQLIPVPWDVPRPLSQDIQDQCLRHILLTMWAHDTRIDIRE